MSSQDQSPLSRKQRRKRREELQGRLQKVYECTVRKVGEKLRWVAKVLGEVVRRCRRGVRVFFWLGLKWGFKFRFVAAQKLGGSRKVGIREER